MSALATKPKITVVTIVLNAAKTLEQTIQSVLNQNYENLEYIIIDGGSTDGSIEIIKKYENRLAKWISEKDNGIADAFNKGICFTSGEVIGLLNADDWYEPGVLEKIATEISQYPDVEIYCGQTRFWTNNNPSYVFHADPSKLPIDTTIGHQAVFIKRRIHEKFGVYRTDKKYASDYDFFLKTYLAGVKFKVLNYVVANMRDAGVSDRHWPKVYREVMEVQQEHLHKKLKPYFRYHFKILRTSLSRTLSAIGAEPIVTFYRKHFSVLRKDKV